MKPLFLILALTATAVGQQVIEPDRQAPAADITRGRVGGDPSRTSTSVRVEGDANKGAGENTTMGATSEGTLRIDPEAAARDAAAAMTGTAALTVTGAASAQPVAPTHGTVEGNGAAPADQGANPSPSPAMDTGAGAER
jgi:hypothetical protein